MTEENIWTGDVGLERLTKPTSGVAAIAAYLRRAIETGAYSEGDKLPPERQLAETFGAARSTVRRALDKLQKEGLVSRRLGSGTFVGTTMLPGQRPRDITDELSPLQLVEARLAVEPMTTRLAVIHATRRTLDEMHAVLAHAEAAADDKDEFSKWDGEFHLLIARASANPLLVQFYRQIAHVRLHAQWNAMKEKILTPDAIAKYGRQHQAILRAIHVRDAQLAQALMIQHLETARDDLLTSAAP